MKWFIRLLTITLAITMSYTYSSPKDKDVILVGEVLHKTREALTRRHRMSPFGTGTSMLHEVEHLSLMFQIRRPLTKEEGRAIAVDCVEEFLKNINDKEELRPYLKNYPFTTDNVRIILYIYDCKGYELIHPEIAVVEAGHNKIIYDTNQKTEKYGYLLHQVAEETYEEAYKLVQAQKESENFGQICKENKTNKFF